MHAASNCSTIDSFIGVAWVSDDDRRGDDVLAGLEDAADVGQRLGRSQVARRRVTDGVRVEGEKVVDVVGGGDADRIEPGQRAGVDADLLRAVHPHADELEIGTLDRRSERPSTGIAGAPLDHAVRHEASRRIRPASVPVWWRRILTRRQVVVSPLPNSGVADDAFVGDRVGRPLGADDEDGPAGDQRRIARVALDKGSQAGQPCCTRLARLHADRREVAHGLLGRGIGHRDENVDPAGYGRPGHLGRSAAVEARHDRLVRAGQGDEVTGLGGAQSACCTMRFDGHDDRSRLQRVGVADHRRGQGSDTHLDDDHIGPTVEPGERDLFVHLAEDRGVALDHPTRHVGIARPGGVRDHDGGVGSERRRFDDRVVVRAVDDGDLGPLAGDRVDARGDRAGRYEDRRVEPEQPRHAGDGSSVVAIGRGGQAQPAQW